MKLNADAILPALLSKGVITFDEKPVFDTKQLQREKMEHLIDKIIVPSLQVGTIEKFNGLLEVMEDSDDTTINAVGKSIHGYDEFNSLICISHLFWFSMYAYAFS